ncbi:MAG: mechanosensitive ion channel [Rhodospirillales bacterium]|nr:mechanosensitive ion channel [Rhodospirillales bacterium]
MNQTIDMNALTKTGLDWLQDYLLDPAIMVQSGIILLSLAIGFFARKLLTPYLNTAIEKTPFHWRGKAILNNLAKLVLQIVALLVLLIATSVASSSIAGNMDVSFAQAIMALLVAWIAIRIVVQFIKNPLSRNMIALTIWILAALEILGILDQTLAALDTLGMNIGEFRLSALTVIKGLIAVFVLVYGAILLSGMAERRINRITGLTVSSRVLIGKIIRITLIGVALLIAITAAGVDLSLFAVFGGAVGLGVGFGLQKVISNLFSGMLLLMDKSIKPGDILELQGGIFGWVEHMGARYTEIVTRDNKSFLIPNEDFITQQVVNWSHGNTLVRIEVSFGVSYEHNPHEVKDLAEEAAKTPERVVADPAPVCHLVEFGESSLNFKLRFWIKDAEKGVTNMRGAVMLALWDTFQEHGIKIPFPQRVVHLQESAIS